MSFQKPKNDRWALLVLTASFLICFKDWFPRFNSKIFLSLDSTVLYYPINLWVHQHLTQGKLPLLCDLAYNGAPVAAVSMAGVLSPFLWLFHGVTSLVLLNNLIFLAPFPLFLFGTYFLGRRLGISSTASLLLAFLWTYNGQRMAQLDHWNVAWALAFFPWAFQALIRYFEEGRIYWLLLGGLFGGLNLLSGHPQIFFLEGLFFLAWALGAPGPLPFPKRLMRVTAFGGVAVIAASPLILFTLECHWDGFSQWGSIDRFFHSWTPLNLITLVFPWFFGRDQYDRAGSDYWWQYQFVEMQVALSIVGLFFILWFLLNRHPQRRWIAWTSAFALLMALGKFFVLYPVVQSLPIFSLFRDPARYWHLGVWALGLGAAWAWDEWFKDPHPSPLPSRERGKILKKIPPSPLRGEGRVRVALMDDYFFKTGRKLALALTSFGLFVILTGWFFLTFGKPLLESIASWFIQHLLTGDPIHTQPLASYLDRLPGKLDTIALGLDCHNPRVFLPLVFLSLLALVVWNRKNWNLDFQKGFLLALVFADLMIFRMPLGNSFYDPSKIPQPAYPASQNRSLVLLQKNISPLPEQYGEMAYTNWNLVSGRPSLAFDANPGLARYDKILADLGWFSWVYKDRDPLGFSKNIAFLYILGVDQIVSDIPLKLPSPFKTVQDQYPYVYFLPETYPKAFLSIPLKFYFDPQDIKDPSKKITSWNGVYYYGFPPNPNFSKSPSPVILRWEETRLSLLAPPSKNHDLFLQKTFLPGWRAYVNQKEVRPFRYDQLLMGVPLKEKNTENHVDLRFDSVGLRLGFFLFFILFGVFSFSLFRRCFNF